MKRLTDYFTEPRPSLIRVCTPAETYQIDTSRVFCKQMVTYFFVVVIGCFLALRQQENETRDELADDDLVSIGRPFRCGVSNGTTNQYSFILADGVFDQYDDNGVFYCYFKSVMVFVSMLMIVPLASRSVRVATIIVISWLQSEVKIPIAGNEYAGDPTDLKIFTFLPADFVMCAVTMVRVINKTAKFKKQSALLLGIKTFLYIILPDLSLTLSLFVVSYYVMVSTKTLEDIVVKLVAVHIFSRLDETYVKYWFRPRAILAEGLMNYVKPNSESSTARYHPIKAFELSLQKHNMGVGEDAAALEKFHEYDGIPFVT